MNVDNVNFRIRVFPSDMRVNVGRLFTSVLAVRAQKSWLLSALVFQMTGKTRFLAEATRAIRTRESCLCLGKRLFDLNETEASRTCETSTRTKPSSSTADNFTGHFPRIEGKGNERILGRSNSISESVSPLVFSSNIRSLQIRARSH